MATTTEPTGADASGETLTAELLLALVRTELSSPSASGQARLAEAGDRLLSDRIEGTPEQLVDCALLLAQHHYLAARPLQALQQAEEGARRARSLGNAALLRKALTFRGVMQMESGNLPGSTASLSEALLIAQAIGDAGAEAAVWNNLGLALQNAAQYLDAMRCFGRAAVLAEGALGFAIVQQQSLANIAGCALQLGEIKAGVHAARQAIDLSPGPATPAHTLARVNAESNYARLLLEIGETHHAAEHAEQARLFAARAPSARAEYIASLSSGLVEIHSRQTDVGLTRIKRALEQARQQVKSEVRDALSACVAGYEAAGQPDVALVYLHELLAMNREARSAQVLLHHAQHLARLDQSQATAVAGASAESHDHALAWQQGKLRGQLGERELTRNRMLLLEQQSVAAELHDDATGEHCYRVGRLASILGREIGLEDDVCFLIDLAARLHDIGKLVVPDAILLKPGRLTPGERAIMETHTVAGADILAKSNVPQMHVAEEIARHHHERWDGSGYPLRLAGNAIPIAARVTALADVYDALTHVRPYKAAWTMADSLAEIRRLRGVQFDPDLTDVFMELVPRLQRAVGDLDAFLAVEAQHSPFIKARRQIAAALKGTDPNATLFELRR